jgi:DNA-binding response OmpR family regulator
VHHADKPIVPRWLSGAIYVTAAGILLLLLGVHVTQVWDWQIDITAFALLGVLLVIPVAERLRKVKVGKYLEADFDALRERVEHVGYDVSDLRDFALSPEERAGSASVGDDRPVASGAGSPIAVSRTIRWIVWVDDKPAQNRLEIDELQRRFEVVTATSTREGLAKIDSPEETLVITDAVRIEGNTRNVHAGLELLHALRERFPAVPVYVYCGLKTVEEHSQPLTAAGARLVTASFTELARRIRTDTRASFEAELAALLYRHGKVEAQTAGVDFVLETGGRRIGVEAKDFRRTPKPEPFDAAVTRLDGAVEAGKTDEGFLITPRDVFIDKQRARTPPTVRLLSIAELPHMLSTETASSPP